MTDDPAVPPKASVGVIRCPVLGILIELLDYPDHGRQAPVDALDVGKYEELLGRCEPGKIRRQDHGAQAFEGAGRVGRPGRGGDARAPKFSVRMTLQRHLDETQGRV